jgi:hypothetical protein
MTLNNRIMHFAAGKHVGKRVTHELTDAQLSLRTAWTAVTMMLLVPRHKFHTLVVMPGLMPGIHGFLQRRNSLVDGRDKPGVTGKWMVRPRLRGEIWTHSER